MRLSELGGKEIVDLQKAERLGILGQTDLEINRETGEIHELIIPTGKWVRKGGRKFVYRGEIFERSEQI